MVYIGNELTTDVLWGNLNGMATIWVNGLYNKCMSLKVRDEELFNLNKKYADQYINEPGAHHEGLDIDLEKEWIRADKLVLTERDIQHNKPKQRTVKEKLGVEEFESPEGLEQFR